MRWWLTALLFEQVQRFALHQLLYNPKQNRTGACASLPTKGMLTPSPGHPAGQAQLTGSSTTSDVCLIISLSR